MSIKATELCKNYMVGGQRVAALDGVSLEVGDGEYVTVVGASGSGKTTLMNILGCLDLPTSGSYFLDGDDVSTLTDEELSEIRSVKIGFIFQSFNLIEGLTALENVELPLLYRHVPKKRRREIALEALESVSLSDRALHRPSEMSGGQQQRVAIARALAAAPPVILADEPTGNLDSASSKEIMQILRELHQEGRTVILITHDNKIAASARRVIRIMDGKIVSDTDMGQDQGGSIEEVAAKIETEGMKE